MTKHKLFILTILIFFVSCGNKEEKIVEKHSAPIASKDGNSISFPDSESMEFFQTKIVGTSKIDSELNAPGKVAATVLPSGEGASQNIILFYNPDLAAHYSQLIQLQTNINQIQNVNIKQKQLELERTEDLLAHGSVTGQELINVQTELSIERNTLANERTALLEHESQLKAGGFSPKILRQAKAGTAYVICDIPENQIGQIDEGESCDVVFTAFPNEKFTGKIDAVADIVDRATRMVKVRITVNNPANKLKSGMFAKVSFGLSEGDLISIDKSALVTVQGKHYVFVKVAANEFHRKEVQIGQQMGDRVLIFSGLENGEEIAVEGVMQLKGLSFGY